MSKQDLVLVIKKTLRVWNRLWTIRHLLSFFDGIAGSVFLDLVFPLQMFLSEKPAASFMSPELCAHNTQGSDS